jgi:hypothetical protein
MPASRRARSGAALLAAGLFCFAAPAGAQVQPPQPSDQSLHEALQQMLRAQYIKESAERTQRLSETVHAMRAGLSAGNQRSFDQLSAQLRTLGVDAAAARLQPSLSPAERKQIVARASDYLAQDRTLATDLHFEYTDLATHAGLPSQPAIPPKPDPSRLNPSNAARILFQLAAESANHSSKAGGAFSHDSSR